MSRNRSRNTHRDDDEVDDSVTEETADTAESEVADSEVEETAAPVEGSDVGDHVSLEYLDVNGTPITPGASGTIEDGIAVTVVELVPDLNPDGQCIVTCEVAGGGTQFIACNRITLSEA